MCRVRDPQFATEHGHPASQVVTIFPKLVGFVEGRLKCGAELLVLVPEPCERTKMLFVVTRSQVLASVSRSVA